MTKAALEAKVEPVAWVREHEFELAPGDAFSWVETVIHKTPLYTTPPQRTWVGLTEEDKQDWIKCMPWPPEPAHLMVLIEGIELELRELNR
jgi:hypothetical protein